MNHDERDDRIPGIDEVREAYRAARLDDVPPAPLDAAILAAAKRPSRRSLRAYLPPLAMAATLVLALGLVLRLTSLGPERSAPPTNSTPALVPRALEPAGDAERAREFVAPATQATTANSNRAQRAAGSAGEAAAPTDRLLQLEVDDAIPACAGPPSDEPDVRLRCIRAAIEAGALDRARSELAAFEAAFPEYPIPEAIATALEP